MGGEHEGLLRHSGESHAGAVRQPGGEVGHRGRPADQRQGPGGRDDRGVLPGVYGIQDHGQHMETEEDLTMWSRFEAAVEAT